MHALRVRNRLFTSVARPIVAAGVLTISGLSTVQAQNFNERVTVIQAEPGMAPIANFRDLDRFIIETSDKLKQSGGLTEIPGIKIVDQDRPLADLLKNRFQPVVRTDVPKSVSGQVRATPEYFITSGNLSSPAQLGVKYENFMLHVGPGAIFDDPPPGLDPALDRALRRQVPVSPPTPSGSTFTLPQTICGPHNTTLDCGFYGVLLADGDTITCSGTLIAPGFVLTAAHCACDDIEDYKDGYRTIIMGYAMRGDNLEAEKIHHFQRQGTNENGEAIKDKPYCKGGKTKADRGDIAILELKETNVGKWASYLGDPATRQNSIALIADPDWDELSRLSDENPNNKPEFHSVGTGQRSKAVVAELATSDSDRVLLSEVQRTSARVNLTEEPHENASKVVTGDNFPNVWEVHVQHDSVGICSGDSGGGLFLPLKEDSRKEGFSHFSLVGVTVGNSETSNCYENDDELTHRSVARNIIRLDTPQIKEWIEEIVGLKALSSDAVTHIWPDDLLKNVGS